MPGRKHYRFSREPKPKGLIIVEEAKVAWIKAKVVKDSAIERNDTMMLGAMKDDWDTLENTYKKSLKLYDTNPELFIYRWIKDG